MKGKKPIWKQTMFWTFAAMIAGAVLGMVFGERMSDFKFIGTIWLNCIKMILVPLVFCTMVLAVGTQTNLKTLGRVALRLFLYYMLTTAVAAALGLATTTVFKPGASMTIDGLATSELASGAAFSWENFFTSLFSSSMFESFSNNNMLQTIVIAVSLGCAILGMKDESKKKSIIHALTCCSDWINIYVGYIIKIAPVAVLFLMADSFGKYGMVLVSSMFKLIGVYWLSVLLHVLIVYCGLLWLTAGVNPVQFLRDSAQVWTFTLASCSSVANIPNGIDCARKKFHIPAYIADFGIPLGANINCDGSAVFQGCILMFIAQMNGLTYSPAQIVSMVLVATLVSSSGGGIPGSIMIKTIVVVETFGLPVEILAVIAGFDRLFDMAITTGNCMGDLAGTVAVANWEKKRAKRLGIELVEEEMHM